MTTRNKSETQLRVKIPKGFDAGDRAIIAGEIIDYIVNRSKEGKNVYNREWSGKAGQYTKQYAKKKGVSTSGPVDLTLSSEMLEKVRYFPSKSKDGEIVVGFRAGTKVAGKAEGNIKGTYGQENPIPGKARPFLDILQKDVKRIVKDLEE